MNPEYETVWSGNTWRQFPTVAPPIPIVRAPKPARVTDTSGETRRVLDVLDANWTSFSAIRDRAHLASELTRRSLRRLVKAGLIETHTVNGPTRYGKPQHFYRRYPDASDDQRNK